MRIRCLAVWAILLTTGLGSLIAQSLKGSDPVALQDRVQQLEELVKNLQQKVNALEAAQAKPSPVAAAPARSESSESKPQALQASLIDTSTKPKEAPAAPVVTFGRSGFAISSSDKSFRLRFGGQFQLDGKFFHGDSSYYSTRLINHFQIRKARPILEGRLGPYIEFRFVPDFGAGKAVLFDGYADFKASPYAVIRAGKFKTPLGLQQLQGDGDLPFIERSLVTDLVPNRSEGVQISGNLRGRLTYQVSMTNSAPVGQSVDAATNRGKDIAARVFLTPFTKTKALQGLGFGAAATSGRQEGAMLPSLNTTGAQTAFFCYGSGSGSSAVVPAAAGHRTNFSPQMYYYNGPFGLMAEYAQSRQKVSAVVGGSTIMEDIRHHAWQVEGTWIMTGEKKSYKSVIPRKGIEGGKEGLGLGAWELALRYSALRVDPTVFALKFADPAKSAQAARNWAVGLNWYMNYFVKLAFNYEQTRFEGGAAPNNSFVTFSNRPTEKVFIQRLQFVF